ncbi:hypothetical protein GCM10010123_35260 [Pilimelia anulata]|uniref:Diguanylate cyclase/phosphodiesterase n=1 Tax=Pilimelia anulata TaxID=53371 RepID=A0A8J3FEW9_9ACTN|nr:bifunctional diguanylate cyclase/phosphodiesterase [Pilimelia anulata]GGK02223.1 hypothetical protein GCM10010123_35260 [Pilimelia anulata]
MTALRAVLGRLPLLLALAGGVAGLAWLALGAAGVVLPVLAGFAPTVLAVGAAAVECWRAALAHRLPEARRYWLRFAGTITLLTAGGIANAVHTLTAPTAHAGQRAGVSVFAWYAAALLVLLWALLRLPSRTEMTRQARLRFAMDAGIVLITAGVFVWYFSFRHFQQWDVRPGNAGPALAIVVLGFIGAFAFLKISLLGAGAVDPVAMRLLALAAAVGAGAGALSPLFAGRPNLVPSVLALPPVAILVALAADRQRRRPAEPPPAGRARRPFSTLPYLAVGALDTLLVVTSWGGRTPGLVVAVAAVVLTAVVVLRQITALRENGSLLRRVDHTVRELRDAQAQLAHQAQHDSLTGLGNRRLFEERLALVEGDGTAASVVLIDLDDFKVINDRLGHATGDALLVSIADRLRGCLRATDTVTRLGGDEFALILPGVTAGGAAELLDRITDALDRPMSVNGFDLLVTSSIGIADTAPGLSPNELLRRADLAMYAAKSGGKGRHRRYDVGLDDVAATDAQLGADLRRALAAAEFTLLFQPIVRLPDGMIVGAEALVRWQHPERGLVRPDQFIAAAERTGLIVPLGEWVLREACRHAAGWQVRDGATQPWTVSVNISARQLREPEIARTVEDALRTSGLTPDRLMIEVTETAVFDNSAAVDALDKISALGVSVALDDFGTGHSSLGLLRSTPVDVLKVDKTFVDGVPGNEQETIIATAMLQIADGLKLGTIAEGVESGKQAEQLHRLGYRYAQGFHFARPMAPADVGARLGAAAGAGTVTWRLLRGVEPEPHRAQ